ncbi:chromatin assembly factor 1 subunit A-like [Ptychodera flava]|uniref:chromatin assembly factor 1 subunit A-like n=1 Tax=Ptychodera flava TaxID=63121 RepID=UPI00396A7EBB
MFSNMICVRKIITFIIFDTVSPESHVFPDEASTSQVQSAPVPERKQPYMPMSPESHVFPDEASTSQVQSAPVPERKQPYMPTICCEANLEIAEKKMKMETTLLMERERQQFELQKERDRHQLELQKERVNQQLELQKETDKQQLKHQKEKDHQQFKKENKEMLRAKLEKLYELEVDRLIARNSPDIEKELENAYEKFKARLDKITEGSLQFMLSFLSEEDIDYFWQKYKAAEVEEVISGILITPEMRSLAEEAGCTVRIRLKIDEKEYELVKEILNDISAVYTFSKKTWVRTVAFNDWERYVLNHVHENQAEYLIQQSRFHPILSELRDDEFFFPSFVSYWYENMYNLPSTLTEATEYAIKLCLPLKQLEVRNVFKTAEDTLHEIGKQAFENYPQRPSSLIQLAYSHDRTGSFFLTCQII